MRYADVVSTLALVVALGGTSSAATQIGSAEIRDGSIRSRDIQDRSLLARDFRPGQLRAGRLSDVEHILELRPSNSESHKNAVFARAFEDEPTNADWHVAAQAVCARVQQ